MSNTPAMLSMPSSLRMSNTTSTAVQGIGQVPVYDRQYMTLHTLQEREMRARLESEKMIRNDLTHLTDGLSSVTNQIQEVASDLKGNLPRLYQESKELRRETQQLTIAFHHNTSEVARIGEMLSANFQEVQTRFAKMEEKFAAFQTADRAEKDDMWAKLCSTTLVLN